MIKVGNLEFTYEKTKTRAVKGIDFNIKKGEIFGLLGPSGAGKTTTQKILIGILKGYKGNLEIMGKERRNWNNDFYENIGVAFEFPNLYIKLSAKENLKLLGSYYKKRNNKVEDLIERVGLLPDIDKRVENYSKGMKMRLNFIRAILHDPEILFLDEPTSGLDPVNSKIIKDMILEMKNKGKTVFLTTHNMTVAEQLCDRVAFIVDGNISLIDSPKELKVRYGSPVVKLSYMEANKEEIKEFSLNEIKNSDVFTDIIKTKDIRTIHSQEATLEEIFIRLTGKELI